MISGLRIVSTFHCRLQTTNKQKSNRQRKPRKEENIKLFDSQIWYFITKEDPKKATNFKLIFRNSVVSRFYSMKFKIFGAPGSLKKLKTDRNISIFAFRNTKAI